MCKINELILELCPNGVEYKNIKDLCLENFWVMPSTPNYQNEGIPYITSKNIRNGIVMFDDVKYITEEDYKSISNNRPITENDFLISMIGTIGEVGIVRKEDLPFYGQNMYLLRLNTNLINIKYFYHYFTSEMVRKKLLGEKNNGNQGYLKTKNIESLKVPVPPVEVQEEIVRILDKFSDNGLEKLLLTELELRKQQYEYYLNLAFKNVKGKRISLGSIVNFQRGKRVVKKDLESNKNVNLFPVYQNSLIPLGYYDKFNFDDNKTIIISAGAAGKIGFVEEKIWAADDCLRCFCSNEILDKFLYYFLKSNENYIQSMVRRASVPRISSSVFGKMLITLPSIDEQKKIIEVFDRF